MQEIFWAEKAVDGKIIYGRTMQSGREPAKKVIVILHGLGNIYLDPPCLNAAYKLVKKGYDCILFNLYGWEQDARHLNDGTLKRFAIDLDFILKQKTHAYKTIFVVGHSYGGATIMRSALKNVTAVSLWDPSYNMADWWPARIFKKKGITFLKGYADVAMPDDLVHEALEQDLPFCRKLSKSFKVPMQVIHAGTGILHKYGESYHTYSKHKTDYVLVKDADHGFTKLKNLNHLVKETDRWFKSF